MTTRRWLLTAGAAAAVVGVPALVSARPAARSSLTAAQLADRVRGSGGRGWSGLVQTSGGLRLPTTASIANLGPLLGTDNQLRAWWRGPQDWRIDRITDSGETDLVRHHNVQLRWTFGSQRAVFSTVSVVRLPDVPDLLPPTLGRRVLAGINTDEIARLPDRRVGGRNAAGLRLTPREKAGTIAQVDLWADPATGLTLAIELYGAELSRPVLTSAFADVITETPAATTTQFVPAVGMAISFDQSIDAAADANALTDVDLPVSLAGFPARSQTSGQVAVYGRGPAAVFVLPLRESTGRLLRGQLGHAGARRNRDGTLARVGPIGLLLTHGEDDSTAGPGMVVPDEPHVFLLAGTVTDALLGAAAGELTS